MIFSDIKFSIGKSEKLYKKQMNDFNDVTLKEYNPMLTSSIFKKEYKDKRQEDEFIKSYLESAKIIMQETYSRQTNGAGIFKMLYTYSLVLPTIYLCRHCLELSIKKYIHLLGKDIKFNHSLMGQWNAFRQYLEEKKINEEERVLLNKMGEFIMCIEKIDDNGMKLRYPKQQDNSDSQKEFLWVNTKEVVEKTELFIQQLDYLIIE